jgi:hypothetical protein
MIHGKRPEEFLYAGILAFAVIVAIVTLAYISDYTGYITGVQVEGGTVTVVDVTASRVSGYWQGFYGQVYAQTGSSPITTTEVAGGVMEELDMTFPCLGNEIYASSSDVRLQNVAAGDKTAIDTKLGVGAGHLESGSSVFSSTASYTVRSSTITGVPTTYTNVAAGQDERAFGLGILSASEDLVFVATLADGVIGFDGKAHDYQMMLPATGDTYHFFVDCDYCGDSLCSEGESCSSCSSDCGTCPSEDGSSGGGSAGGGGGGAVPQEQTPQEVGSTEEVGDTAEDSDGTNGASEQASPGEGSLTSTGRSRSAKGGIRTVGNAWQHFLGEDSSIIEFRLEIVLLAVIFFILLFAFVRVHESDEKKL